MLVLCIGSLLPNNFKVRLGTTTDAQIELANSENRLPRHRLYHILSFGSTALLFCLLASTRRREWESAIAVFLLGVVLELTQHLVYGNIFEWWDVRDDALGVAIFFLLWRLADRKSA